MPLVVKDRVMETTSSTGTGTITLGGAVVGFQSFSVIGNGNTTYYAIVGGTEWEIGLGTYTSAGTTLSRTTVLESSNGGSLVNFSAGTKNVFVTYAAEKSVYKEANDYVYLPSNLEFTGTGNRITGDFSNATASNRVAFQSSTTNGNTGVYFIPNGTSTTANITLSNSSTPDNSSLAQLAATSTEIRFASTAIGTGTTLPMTFYTGGSERMRINTSGAVIIGNGETSGTPAAGVLEATDGSGTNIAGASLTIQGGRGTGTGAGGSLLFSTAPAGTTGSALNAAQTRMTIDSNGNVGIGTGSPAGKLDIVTGTYRAYFDDAGGAFVRLNGVNAANSAYGPIAINGSQVLFTINATERMRIDATGNVTVSKAVRGTITTDNDLSFDMNAASNFTCTPTANGTLTFTNITSGQSGYVLLVNTGGYVITAAATTKVNSTFLSTVSTAGTYLLSYFSNGTNVYVTTAGAMA